MFKLLTREEFNRQVFERDGGQCVVPGCYEPPADAHHIIERKLFTQADPLPGGYAVENGASLCERHHIHAEEGFFPPQALRRWIGLPIVLPAGFDDRTIYDKWGNRIEDLGRFRVKYPKTPYFNFSPGFEVGDRFMDLRKLVGKPLLVTTKKDGACVTLSRDVCGARNGSEADHPMFDMLKARHAAVRMRIEPGIQLFGEWLLAKHSIHYAGELALADYLQIFAAYDQDEQLFVGSEELARLCDSLGLQQVAGDSAFAFICSAEWQLVQKITEAGEAAIAKGEEGIVVKSMYPFHYSQFADNVAKYVRADHIQTGDDWRRKAIVKNELRTP